MTTIAIRADYMMHAYRFVSTEETRFYLNGVCLSAYNGGMRIAATDGHRLGMFWQEGDAPSRDLIVRLEKATLKACARHRSDAFGDRWLVLEYGADQPSITNARIVSAPSAADALLVPADAYLAINGCAEIDGTFPDIMRVLPAPHDGACQATGFNSEYLASFGFVREKGDRSAIHLTPGKDFRDPAGVLNGAYPEFFGVLMPLRFDGGTPVSQIRSDGNRPAWLQSPTPVTDALAKAA